MVTAGIAALTGAILACFQQQSIEIYWLSLLPVSLFFIFFHRPGRYFWLLVSSFLYTSLHIYLQLDQRLPLSIAEKPMSLTGVISSIPSYRGASARFIFAPIDDEQGHAVPQRIRLSWKHPPESLMAGQQWHLQIKIKPAHGFQNPGGFDYERWLFLKGIQATGYVLRKGNHQLLGQNLFSINRIRQSVNHWVASHCLDCRYTGLLLALTTGYRGEIDKTQRALLQDSGTAHLIAISGLHIGVIATFTFFLGGYLWNRLFFKASLNRREFSWLISWIAVLLYSLLSGFQLPAQRAFIMFSVLGMLVFLRVPFNLLNTIITTLIVVIIVSPLSVLSESFWLTFCALGIILLGSFLLQHEPSRWRQLLLIQVLFSLLFIPLSLVIFDQIYVASLLANLIAVPLVSLIIVPANFALLMLFFLPDNWLNFAYSMMDGVTGLLLSYLQFLQQLGLQAVQLYSVNSWQLLLLLMTILLWVLPSGMLRMRGWKLLLPLVILWPNSHSNGDLLKLTVLDVGTGAAVVIQTSRHALVYDFGPGNRTGFSVGAWVVEPFLNQQGISQVDQIIISHNDQDHAGGLYSVVEDFRHIPVISGTPASLRRSFPELPSVRDCHHIQPWHWDGVVFEFLMMPQDTSITENNRSCVLRISTHDQHILLTGDIEASQEQRLVEQEAERLESTVLLAPHHGSKSSSSKAFIQAVAAQHVIFSAGFLNHWHFPQQEVVQRYLESGAEMFRTDRDGAIQVICDENRCRVEKFRQLYPRIWY